MSRILITGGTGCIGAVTIYKLLQSSEVEKITVASRSVDARAIHLWTGREIDSRVEFIKLDISDYESVRKIVPNINPTAIIHLGGLQSPDCSANHIKGMDINVGGTVTLFDTAEKLPELKRFVFASSGAVYGKRAIYPDAKIGEEVRLEPPNHYGIWKLAGEHLARLFHDNTGISAVCLRLNTTYGLGRDKGMTAAPTTAMKSVAFGAFNKKPSAFAMPYQGRENYHYVEDVGEHFAACTLQEFNGYGFFNIKGQTVEVKHFIDTVKHEAEQLGWGKYVNLSIADNAQPNMFSHDLNHDRISRTFDNLPLTMLGEGIRKSLLAFYKMAEKGELLM